MIMWIYEHKNWPNFIWDAGAIAGKLAEVRHQQGRLLGRMEVLGFDLRREASLETLTSDVVKSSAIEGEILNPKEVRSSLARRLGLDIAGLVPASRNVEGIVEFMLDATQKFSKPLTKGRLFDWHAALFPTGRSGMQKITVGGWRTQIEQERKAYYDHLERQQRSEPDIAEWLSWFLDCLGSAITNAEATLSNVLFKAELWKKINQAAVNERQRNVINRMLEDGFTGFMNTSKYAKLAKCSNDTALRDIQDLVARGVFLKNEGGGRSSSYRLTDRAS